MSDAEVTFPKEEFERELQALSAEAQQYIEERTIKRVLPALIKAMRPVVVGIEALSRATEQNTLILSDLRQSTTAQDGLTNIMAHVQEQIDQRQMINQQLFDALHAELKDYKDGFLLEIMQKPVVRDLIDLYDLLSGVVAQFQETLDASREGGEQKSGMEPFETLKVNLGHTRETLLEILERMEVTMVPSSSGVLDKTRQRAVLVEPAESSEDDLMIARSLKAGFQWRDRMIRPEEVVIKKWKEGYLMMMGEQPVISEDDLSETDISDKKV